MVTLAEVKSADFNYLKQAIGATDGNLSTHLSKLDSAGYVQVSKGYRGKKPLTSCRLTRAGRAAFGKYLEALKAGLSL